MNTISVIIPTFNEEKLIERLCVFLLECQREDERLIELIVVDACSTDSTKEIVSKHGLQFVLSDVKSRAAQLNKGAEMATGDTVYFVHADVLPPKSFIQDIMDAVSSGIDFGCFSYCFEDASRLLKFNAKFTRKDSKFIGGGDQTLFMKRSVFQHLGGFAEDHIIMEDYELYWRAKSEYKQKIICNDALVSARKYDKNAYLRVQFANLIVFNGYRLGVNQNTLVKWYRKMLN